jgi:tRNA dimethylallyltransferase
LIQNILCDSDYTAGCFFDDARAATEDVLARGSVPIVVGGTGMYLRWYVMFYHIPFKVTIEVLSLSSV